MMDRAAEEGFVAGADALLVGTLVFVVGTILAINAWSVVDAQFAVDAAAREAARVVVEAPDPRAASGRALEVALAAVDAHGRNPANTTVTDIVIQDGEGVRCASVTVTVEQAVETLRAPFASALGTAWTVTGRHTEIVDPFRAGFNEDVDDQGETRGVNCGF